jgi:hypothetical protein
MKAALDKSQLMVVAGGGVGLLAAGALAWFGLGGLGEKQAEAQALTERMGNPALAALMSDPGGAARAGKEAADLLKLGQELEEKEGAMMRRWAEGTKEAAGDGQEWAKDPGKWKDELIRIQSALQKSAPASQVRLAPDFYLGLEAFRQKSPTAEEVPGLALHLKVAEKLVMKLLEARKRKEQFPTVCEFRSLTGPGSGGEKAGAAAPGKPGAVAAGPERQKFKAEVRCSPEVLYEYLRLLAVDPWLLVVTGLEVANEKESFPLRSEIAKKFTAKEPGAAGAAGGAKEEKKLLEILAGEESLKAVVEVDFVAWRNPEEAKAGTPPPASP